MDDDEARAPGTPKDLGYRAHFARMGFDAAINALEARHERRASAAEIADQFPRDLLLRIGYYGAAGGAAAASKRLAERLDLAIVRVVAARPAGAK